LCVSVTHHFIRVTLLFEHKFKVLKWCTTAVSSFVSWQSVITTVQHY
jgi:hypothetical protein